MPTGILGLHYLQDSILDAFAVSAAQLRPLHQFHLCWALRTCCFLLHSLTLMAMLSNPLIYWFSDKIIVLPFHRDLSSVYNRLGMVFVFETWSLCLTVLQPSALLLRSMVAFDPRSSPLLPLSCTHPWLWGTSPRLHLWPLLSFFFLLLTLRNFLQQHAPCKHLQACHVRVLFIPLLSWPCSNGLRLSPWLLV